MSQTVQAIVNIVFKKYFLGRKKQLATQQQTSLKTYLRDSNFFSSFFSMKKILGTSKMLLSEADRVIVATFNLSGFKNSLRDLKNKQR